MSLIKCSLGRLKLSDESKSVFVIRMIKYSSSTSLEVGNMLHKINGNLKR